MGKKPTLGEEVDIPDYSLGEEVDVEAPSADPFASAPSSDAFVGGGAGARFPRPGPTASPSMQGGGAPHSESPSARTRLPFKGLDEAPDRQPEFIPSSLLDGGPVLERKNTKPMPASDRKRMEEALNMYSQDFTPGVMEEKRRIREALALDDDIRIHPERHDPDHPDYARVHGMDARYDVFFSDMDEPSVKKNRARLEQEVGILKKEGDALAAEESVLPQIEADINKHPEGSPERNAFINEYNTLITQAQNRQKAMEDMARSIDADNELLTRREVEILRGKGSWGGAAWNSVIEGMGKMNRSLFGDLLPDLYVEMQDEERIKKLGGKDKFKRDMKAVLSEDIMGEEGFGGVKSESTTQAYIDRIKKEHPILGGGILGLAESAPAMATPYMAGTFLQVSDGLNQEMAGEEWDGVNEWEKKGMSYLGGAVGMSLERFGFKNLVNNSAATKQIIARVIDKVPVNATPGQIQRVLDAETSSWAKNFAVRVIGGGAAEAETGAAQEVADVTMKAIYNEAKGKQLFDTPESVSEFSKDVMVAGLQEMIGGKIMATPIALSSAMSTKGRIKAMEDNQYEFLEKLLKDPDFQATWDAKAQADMKSGKMTKAQYEKTVDDWGVAQSVADQMPDGLPVDKRREAFDILLEKQKLKGKDKTLSAARMAALDDRLAALVGQPAKEEAKAATKEEAPAKEPEAPTPPPVEEAVTPKEDAIPERQTEEVPVLAEARGGEEVRAPREEPSAEAPPVPEEGKVAPTTAAVLPDSPVRLEGEPEQPKQQPNKKEDEQADGAIHSRGVERKDVSTEIQSKVETPPPAQAPPGVPLEDAGEVTKAQFKREAKARREETLKRADNAGDEELGVRGIVLRYLANEGMVDRADFMRETGERGRGANKWMWAHTPRKKGVKPPTIEALAHSLWEGNSEIGDTQDYRNAIIEVLHGHEGRGQIIESLRSILPRTEQEMADEQQADYERRFGPIEDASSLSGVSEEEIGSEYDAAAEEWASMTDKQKQDLFNEIEQAQQQEAGSVQREAGDSISRGETSQAKDSEREALAQQVDAAKRKRDAALKDWNSRGQALFGPDVGARQASIGDEFDNSQENFDRITAPLNERVRNAEAALAAYDAKAGERKKAAEQQTSIPEAPAKKADTQQDKKKPVPDKPLEPRATQPASDRTWKRTEAAPVPKPTVLKEHKATSSTPEAKEYAIQGFEEYPVVAVKEEKGWKVVMRVGDLEMAIVSGHPTHGIAAGAAHEKMSRAGKEKLDAAVERAMAAQEAMKEEGPREQRPMAQMPTAPVTQDDVDALAEQITKDTGVKTLSLSVRGKKDLRVDMIGVEKGKQGHGIGSKAMQQVVDFADRNGLRITLSPSPADANWGTTSRGRLVDFYKRFGFKENKGRNKDFTVRDGMIREPQSGPMAQAHTDRPATTGKPNTDKVIKAQEAANGTGVSEQRPFRSDDADAIGFNYTTDAIARERFDLPSLEKIGSGSDRDVYDLGDGRVLKIAKTARGLEQNMYEGEHIDFLPDTHEKGMNYVVVDKVEPAKASDVIEYEGYDGGESGTTTIGEMLKDLSRFSQRDADDHTSEFQDAVNKYGFNDVMNYNILWNDFIAKRNWGVKDGRAVHLDGGTFGGVRMIDDFRGKKNLDDADFREIYNRSRTAKKQFGDRDKATMYQRPTDSATIKTGRPRLDRVLNAMKDMAPGLNIIVHDTKQAYSEAVAKEGQGLDSSWGVYAPSSNTIHVSPASPDLKQTLFHETAHPIILALARNNPDRIVDFVHEVRNHPDGKRYQRFASRYRDLSVEAQMNEVLAEFMGDVASGKVPVSTKPDSLWQRFKDFIKDILAALGWDMRTIDLSKPTNVREFAAQFKKAMDKGIRITGLTPVDVSGISMQRPKTTKAAEWNAAVKDATDLNNLLNKGEEKSILDAADLITDPDGKAEFIRLMNEQMGVTTPPLGTKTNQKKVSKAYLRDEFAKAVEAGKRAGIADVAKARKEFVAQVKEALSKDKLKGSLSDAQARSIATRAASTNPLNPKAVERFLDYAGRMAEDVMAAEKESVAKKLRKRIKTAIKGKADERRDAMVNDLAGDFTKLNLDEADIDEYIGIAERLMKTLDKPKAKVGKAAVSAISTDDIIANTELQEYIDKQRAADDASAQRDAIEEFEAMRDALGIDEAQMTSDELKSLIDSINGIKARTEAIEKLSEDRQKTEMLRTMARVKINELEGYAAFMNRGLDTAIPADRMQVIDDLKSIDADRLKGDEAAFLITSANNVMLNDRWGGLRDFAAKGRAERGFGIIAKAFAPLKRIGRPGDEDSNWRLFNLTDTTEIMAEKIARGPTAAAEFMRGIGMHQWLASISDAKRRLDETVARREDFAKSIGFNKKRDDTLLNRYRMGFYAYLIQNKGGSPEQVQQQFDKRAENVRTSIERMRNKNKFEHLSRVEDIYIKAAEGVLGDANDASGLSISPMLRSLVEFQIAENERLSDSTFSAAELDHNKVPRRYVNYTRQKSMPSRANLKADQQKDLFEERMWGNRLVDSTPSSSKMDRSDSLLEGHVINPDLFSVQDESLFETIADNIGAQHLATLRESINDPRMEEYIGAGTVKLLQERVRSIKGLEQSKGDLLSGTLAKLYYGVAKRSMQIALKGIFQAPKQATVAVSTYIGLGKDANLMWGGYADAINTWRDPDSWQNNLIKDEQIHERGKTIAGLEKLGDPISKKTILTGEEGNAERVAKVFAHEWGVAMDKGMLPLSASDSISAQAAWFAFYKKKLKEKGVDLDSDGWKRKKDEEAAAYANQMVSRQQNANAVESMSQIYREKGMARIMVDIFFSYSSFALNMRKRMARDIQTLLSGANEDKSYAARDLVGLAAETVAFSTVTYFLAAMAKAGADEIADHLFGPDDDDEPLDEEWMKDILARSAFDLMFTGFPEAAQNLAKSGINEGANDIAKHYGATIRKDGRDLFYVPEKAGAGRYGAIIDTFVNAAIGVSEMSEEEGKALAIMSLASMVGVSDQTLTRPLERELSRRVREIKRMAPGMSKARAFADEYAEADGAEQRKAIDKRFMAWVQQQPEGDRKKLVQGAKRYMRLRDADPWLVEVRNIKDPETRAIAFWNRMKGLDAKGQRELRDHAKRVGGIVTKDFREHYDRLRKEEK